MFDAVAIMAERRISELPVIDADLRPVGMLDITDIMAEYPESAAEPHPNRQTLPACRGQRTGAVAIARRRTAEWRVVRITKPPAD